MKKPRIAIIIITVLVLLTSCGGAKYDAWPSLGLATLLPDPQSGKINVIVDSDSSVCITVDFENDSFGNDYISKCMEKGFTVEAEKDTYSYSAYNEEGYKLRIVNFGSNINIELNAPIKFDVLRWPGSDAAAQIPKPDSTKGKIEVDSSDCFSVIVGDMDNAAFNDYIEACIEKGFDNDYERQSDYYYALNDNGYYVKINYEYKGLNTISIVVEKTEQRTVSSETTAVPETTSAPETTAAPETTSAPETTAAPETTVAEETDKTPSVDENTIRPEIKEAIDSYEAFVDKYCAFIENYDSSDLSELNDYLDLINEEIEMSEKFEAIEEDNDLTEAESDYYFKVSMRCLQKIADVNY